MEEVTIMQLIYEGKDITSAVEIHKTDVTDNAGGVADSLEVGFDDPKNLWSQWKPKKNDTVEIIQDGFSSGVMYVDELEQGRGIYTIRALSIPQEAKTENTKAWEQVRFLELATEISSKYGFQLQTYGIQNYLYERLDQSERADFEYLSWRCMLEGYALKLTGEKAVIYDERYMEGLAPVKTIYGDQFDGSYRFKIKSTDIFRSCRITFGSIQYEFQPANGPAGPVLKINELYVSSQGEAERYAKSLLRYKNKFEYAGYFTIELDTSIAAANNIQVQGVGYADGKYFCEQVIHRLVDKKSFFKVRKPLEGY